ncbi:OsmC family protein [Oricola cellulosilytica]|uniref:OsmC family peroxiredoxin n=1 Tax=Oricola cellulosilytica TaxID=1429082 RepID=A0A4V2MP18_9HYPH|nr:OsmC family protein [Oricola cellulosilytica]TCD15912.1 OsmC family peroxiredoxin [Oricola cellulosilytica]
MKRNATAVWEGDLQGGRGHLTTQSGVLKDKRYDFRGRFEDEEGKSGTNPEELLAAAHAGCFAMQLSHLLAENGTPAEKLEATATVEIKPGEGIKGSALVLKAEVPGMEPDKFSELATKAKEECPVSQALASITVSLDASLV